jgi:hypothetical protein
MHPLEIPWLFCEHFAHCLSAVAGVTKALQVTAVGKLGPVAFVVHDVIHIGGPRPESTLGTLPAKRLYEELRWSEIVQPLSRLIHPPPRTRLRTAAPMILGPMSGAVTVTR